MKSHKFIVIQYQPGDFGQRKSVSRVSGLFDSEDEANNWIKNDLEKSGRYTDGGNRAMRYVEIKNINLI